MTAVWLPDGPPAVTLADLRSRLVAGHPPGDLRGLPVRVRDAVTLARRMGAPVLPALDAALGALDDDRRRDRALRVATAQARAVAGGLLALPVVLVPGLGRLLDLDLLGFYRTGGGVAVAAIAAALVVTAAVVTGLALRRATRPRPRAHTGSLAFPVLVTLAAASLAGPVVAAGVATVAAVLRQRSATRVPADLDAVVDLVATALAGGGSVGAALRAVADLGVGPTTELRRLALCHELGHPAPAGPLAPLAAVLVSSAEWGAPAVPTLQALARDLRAEALSEALAAAERLPAQLTFPTALCLLPAAVLLIGAPLVTDGLATAAGAR